MSLLDKEFDTVVRDRVGRARGIAFDTCHKIYVLMDDKEMESMRGYGYDPLISADEMNSEEMLTTLRKWYDASCGLRFIQAVTHNEKDPNEGFEDLIPQGFGEEEDWEEV